MLLKRVLNQMTPAGSCHAPGGNSLILIVENSTKAEKIDLARIFEKDYSSKGEGRGLGLYKIQQLLEKYPKTTVSTKSSNYRFTQSLTFGRNNGRDGNRSLLNSISFPRTVEWAHYADFISFTALLMCGGGTTKSNSNEYRFLSHSLFAIKRLFGIRPSSTWIGFANLLPKFTKNWRRVLRYGALCQWSY